MTSAGKRCIHEQWIDCIKNWKTVTKQDRQHTYHATSRHVRATIIEVEKQLVLYILRGVSSLRYPACNAHVPYCHLWPAWLYNIFPHYLI